MAFRRFILNGVISCFPRGILRAETMRFADELRSPKEIGLPEKKKVPAAKVRKFEKMISGKSKKQFAGWKPQDEQTEALLKLVKKKQTSRKNVIKVETDEGGEQAEVIDLMQVLKRSLAGKR